MIITNSWLLFVFPPSVIMQKDTAGPSLHVVIKLLSTTVLIAGPLFIAKVPTA